MSIRARILVGLVILLGLVLLVPVSLLASDTYRSFYIPSESMMPTFRVGDRFIARMSAPVPLRRGDVVLARTGRDAMYVERVAGLPGDRIQLIDGTLYLNGSPVAQRLLGEDPVTPSMFGTTARRLAEQFPGEAAPHEIYDSGESVGDNYGPELVAPGHVFLLGDNRDHSADSRFPHAELGLEQVPLGDLAGAPVFFTMTGGRHRFGDSAAH